MNDFVIRLTDVSIKRGEREILAGINLDVKRNDFIAITGPNGGGKTTLLRIILKLLEPTSGKVEYFNNGQATETLKIGYLPQKNAIDSKFPISVEEVIESGLLADKTISKEVRKKRIDEILALVEMKSLSQSPIGNLSGGQLQRTLLGRALISKPEILILDEPLSYIDKRFEQHIYNIISNLKGSTSIILVSHEMSVIAGMANRHLIVDHELHECGAHHHFTPSECF